MVLRRRVSCLLVSAVLVGVSARGYAQVATAALTVTVLDPSNAAVPEARVTVTSIDVGLERAGDSGPDGVFTVADLPPGAYRLTVMRAGFAPGHDQAHRPVLAHDAQHFALPAAGFDRPDPDFPTTHRDDAGESGPAPDTGRHHR
jgi:hypothetical protein